MNKYQTKRQEGFTIIEVLIVLAIAGLIMLVVFLAVPNLQRSQRNNAYRNEATQLIGAYNEISSNNNGAVLVAADSANVLTAANVRNITALTIQTQAGVTAPSLINAVFRTGARCTAANSAVTPIGSTRQAALLFVIEQKGTTYNGVANTAVQCLEV